MKLFERLRHFIVAVSLGAALHGCTHEVAHFAHEVALSLGAELAVRMSTHSLLKMAEID